MEYLRTDLISATTTLVKTLSGSNVNVTTAVALSPPGGTLRVLQLKYQGTACDGGDAMIPALQTSYDGGTTYYDLVSTASMAGGVVASVTERVLSSTPPAAARKAASDGAIAASTVLGVELGTHVRIKAVVTDADDNATWSLTQAFLIRYL